MALLPQDGPDLKARLEQGVWLDTLERSYSAWWSAPNQKKPSFLLTGPTLTWAESWMLSHPPEMSASLKQYIVRSLTAQSRKSAGERDVIETEQRRKDTVYRYLLITMSLFALLVLAPGIVRDLLGYQFDSNIPAEIARGPQIDPTAPVDDAAAPNQPAIEDSTPASLAGPAQTAPAKIEHPFAKLARAVQISADKGDARLANLLAAEFFESLKLPQKSKDEARLRDLARSTVGDAFATQSRHVIDSERLSELSPAVGCPATTRFVGLSRSRQLRVWDGNAMNSSVAGPLKPRQIKSEAVDRDCARLVTVSEDYELIVNSLSGNGKVVRLGAHEADIIGIGLSGDGSKIVSVSRDSVGKIWDVSAGRRVADLRVDDSTFSGAALSLDGTRAVTWAEEQVAHVWDATTGRLLGKLEGHQAALVRAEFAQDGNHILTLSLDGTAILWRATDFKEVQIFRAETGSIIDARFSPNGRYVAVMNEAAAVQVFDNANAGVAVELSTGNGNIRAISFSQDSQLVATMDWSGGIVVWRASDGERLADLNRRNEPVAAVMFSTDNARLAALGTSGSITTWTLTTDLTQVAARIRSAGYACLSQDERRQFGVETINPAWCKAADEAPAEAAAPVPSGTDGEGSNGG